MAPLDTTAIQEERKVYYLQKILNSTVQQGPHGCRVWQNPVGGNGYPRMRITLVAGGGSSQYSVHQVVLACSTGTVLDRPFFEVSHLCHNKLCVEVTHLTYEPKVVNVQRRNCVAEGHCFGHQGQDSPDCLL